MYGPTYLALHHKHERNWNETGGPTVSMNVSVVAFGHVVMENDGSDVPLSSLWLGDSVCNVSLHPQYRDRDGTWVA